MKRAPVQVGARFGRLVVTEQLGKDRSGKWTCRVSCDCGTSLTVREGNLKSGGTRSCGCLNRDMTASRNLKHGLGGTPEAQVWRDIRKRCLNPRDRSYPNYGGRGITVCPGWVNSFEAFIADVGPRPSASMTLDRIDNERGYEPGNVRWVPMKVQQRNKRTNVKVHVDGRDLTLIEVAEVYGLTKSTAITRVRRAGALGIPLDEALRCPSDLTSFKRLQVKYGHNPY